MTTTPKKSSAYSWRVIVGSLLGLAGIITVFVGIFTDWRILLAGVGAIIVGAAVAGLRNLREFISNILSF